MSRRLWISLGLVAAVVVAPIAWYLVSPLFISRTVNEEFPVAAAAPAASAMSDTAMASPETSMAASMAPEPTASPESSMAASMAAEPIASPEASMEASMAPEPMASSESSMAASMEAAAPASPAPMPSAAAEPRLLRSGEFHAVVHEGMGTAAIYALPDGTRVLRLENFEVLNGPDLYVWLSSAADASDSRTILAGEYAEVGRLKGDRGNQNYVLPADLDLDRYNSVTIWCRRFSVNFVTAPLRSASATQVWPDTTAALPGGGL